MAAHPANAGPWLAAQARQALALAGAAREAGRLEAMMGMLPVPKANGACRLLALLEVEAMLWAHGLTLRRDEIGRDLMDARAGSDPEATRLARWAVRRLDGQGVLADLAAFLGLHRRNLAEGGPAGGGPAPPGTGFDAAVAEFTGRSRVPTMSIPWPGGRRS